MYYPAAPTRLDLLQPREDADIDYLRENVHALFSSLTP